MSDEKTNGKKRVKPITLDKLPPGTEETLEAEFTKSRRERRMLPDTIENRELYRDIVQIAWPSLCELFLTSLVNMVDNMMVGNLGDWAISAVGLATQPRFIFMNLIMALNTGTTAMISRARGRQDREQADRILRQCMVLVTFIGVISAALGYALAEPMVRFMANEGLEPDVLRAGTQYLRIQFLFFPTVAITSTITASLKGTGQAKPSMVYNTVANLVNICFNWLLINGHWGFPRLEVAGASIATGIGQTVALGIALWCAFSGRFYCTMHFKHLLSFEKDTVSGIVKVGVPSMIEQLFMRVGMIIFTRTVTSLGSVQFASHIICMNIQSMSFMIGQGFAVSSTALVGLYNKDEELLALGSYIMIYVAVLQPFQANQFILGGSLRGAGDTRFTAMVMLITIVGIRTALAYLLVTLLHMELTGAWIAVAADQIARSLIIMWRYNTGKWKKIKL